jgi:hypothetical protein
MKKRPVYLYSRGAPEGRLFADLSPEAEQEKLAEGWFDSPAKITADPVVGDAEAELEKQRASNAAKSPKGGKTTETKADGPALRAMFLKGDTGLTTAQTKELATFLGVKFKKVGESTDAITAKIAAVLNENNGQQSGEGGNGSGSEDPGEGEKGGDVPPLKPQK